MNPLIWIGLGIGLVVALIIPDSREWILEYLGEAWEITTDLFSNAFEDIGEISYVGVAFGAIAFGVVYIFRNQMLNAFLSHMSPMGQIFWGALTYIGTFAAGYFVGNAFEKS